MPLQFSIKIAAKIDGGHLRHNTSGKFGYTRKAIKVVESGGQYCVQLG